MDKQLFIDTHIHLTPPTIIEHENEFREEEPYFDLLSSSPKNKFITVENLIEYMERTKMDRAVVFGFAFRNKDNIKLANNYIIDAIGKYPDKLIGFAVINPSNKNYIKELERCKRNGLQGVGELFAEGQKFNLDDKEVLQPLCEFCHNNEWPVLIHLNEPVGHYYKGKTKDSIIKGEKLAENFPDTIFIFAHWGGGLCFYELMPEMRNKLKNVYYDTAANPFLYDKKMYEVIKKTNIINKILLGSDYPLISPSTYRDELLKTNLTPQERSLIMGVNASKLLNL